MNKDFEKDYINITDSSAPDMDKLWEKISSSETADTDITPFVSAAEECERSRPVRKNNVFRAFAAAAAVFAAAIFAVSALSDSSNIAKSESAPSAAEGYAGGNGCADIAMEECEEAGYSYVTAGRGWDYSNYLDSPEDMSYLSLSLAHTESSIYTAMSRNTDDEEYFVEDRVLSETDLFLDGEIISAEPLGDGGVKYTVKVIHAVADESREFSETEEIFSNSPYTLRTGREYLLPISEKNGRYDVIFDNAPQIEFTLDRQLVCHNGWKTLSEQGVYISYPQVYPDDFFYDRMNLAAESSLERLFDRWESLRA